MRVLVRGVLFCIAFTFIESSNAASPSVCDRQAFEKTINRRVDRQLRKLGKKQHGTARRSHKLRQYIDGAVEREIHRRNRYEQKRFVRNTLAGRSNLYDVTSKGGNEYGHTIPSWPFFASTYSENDLFEFAAHAHVATKSYSSSGRARDLSKLVLQEESIRLSDVLLTSKLLKNGLIIASGANDGATSPTTGSQFHYLFILADVVLNFDASTERYMGAIKYARHFRDGDISFGFELPVVKRKNNIRLVSELSASQRNDLETFKPRFFERFGSLENFFTSMLEAKGMLFGERDGESGIGDILTFFNVEINSYYLERFLVGGTLLIPTSKNTLADRLWYPDLGNGGFIEYGLFTSMMWTGQWYFNPHFFLHARGSIATDVKRRVPKKRTYDGNAGGSVVGSFLELSTADIVFGSAPFSEFDTTVARFAAEDRLVKVQPGPSAHIRVGNVFAQTFSRRDCIGVYYDAVFKGKDTISSGADTDFNFGSVTRKSWHVSHDIGGSFIYQLDSKKRLHLAGSYTFAGRNTPEVFTVEGRFDVEF